MPGRLAKLEGAISKQRTVKFDYWSISSDKATERTLNPYALVPDNGIWYVVGRDLDREDIRTFRVSRIRGEIKFATRRERDFRTPQDFDVEQYRGRPPWQIGDLGRRGAHRGARRHRLVGPARVRIDGPRRGRRLRHGVLVAAAARVVGAAPGRARRSARAGRAAARGRVRAPARARRPRRPGGEAGRRAAREGRRRHGRAARRPGRAGAVRRAPGAARVPARRLRRRRGGRLPRDRDPRALPDPRRTSSRSTSRC